MTTQFNEIITGEIEISLAKKRIKCKYRMRVVFTKWEQAELRTDVVKKGGKRDT